MSESAILYKCEKCGLKVDNKATFLNHIRWAHKNKSIHCRYCKKDIRCGISKHEAACKLNPQNIKYCVVCGKILTGCQQKTCSDNCSSLYIKERNYSYNHICNETLTYRVSICKICKCYVFVNNKVLDEYVFCEKCRKIVLENQIQQDIEQLHNKALLKDQICVECGNIFHYHILRKTCSSECCTSRLTRKSLLNRNCGGETNFRRFRYNDISMDSSWEVNVAKYMDEHNIKWQRSKKLCFMWHDEINKKRRRYHPDFYLPQLNIYIDTKNDYLIKKDAYKINQVLKEYDIKILIGDDKQVISQIENLKEFK